MVARTLWFASFFQKPYIWGSKFTKSQKQDYIMNRVFFILVFVFISGFAGIIVAQEEKGAVDYNNEAVEAYKNKDYKTAYAAFSKAIELYKAEGSDRITSYNVCYTKLLRVVYPSFSAFLYCFNASSLFSRKFFHIAMAPS